MSIFPSTDIISDVAGAADPRKVHVAMKRLNDFAAARVPQDRNFAAALDRQPTALAAPPTLARTQAASVGLNQYAQETKPAAVAAAEKFEAYILQTWLEVLLPKEDGAFYGTDGAGGVWRSMMAEQLGDQVAKAGGVGLRRLLAADHAHAATSQGVSTPPA